MINNLTAVGAHPATAAFTLVLWTLLHAYSDPVGAAEPNAAPRSGVAPPLRLLPAQEPAPVYDRFARPPGVLPRRETEVARGATGEGGVPATLLLSSTSPGNVWHAVQCSSKTSGKAADLLNCLRCQNAQNVVWSCCAILTWSGGRQCIDTNFVVPSPGGTSYVKSCNFATRRHSASLQKVKCGKRVGVCLNDGAPLNFRPPDCTGETLGSCK